jgi:hypothetical protein|tara:strand:- start:106 stop:498 length:393 start_codon:yes stop_codon:yes gene_type:complete
MANRRFQNFQAYDREVKRLYCKATIGASGAPTLVSDNSLGIKSIARNSAGDYTVTFGDSSTTDKYNKLLWADGKLLDAAGEDIRVQIQVDSVSSDGQIQVLTLTGASATDPSNGSTLFLVFDLKNSSVTR